MNLTNVNRCVIDKRSVQLIPSRFLTLLREFE